MRDTVREEETTRVQRQRTERRGPESWNANKQQTLEEQRMGSSLKPPKPAP